MICLPTNNYLLNAAILIHFKNGSVGLFNIDKNKMEYISDATHSETVFDIRFSNIDQDILATGSYDGFVKIWDIHTMKCLFTLSNVTNTEKKYNPIYGLSWSPNSNELVTVDALGTLKLWDCAKGKMISALTPGKDSKIFRVKWNPLNASLIASGSSEECA